MSWEDEAGAIRRGSPIPLYLQFRQHLLDLVEAGKLPPGSRLPPEGDLAVRYGVSLAPVRRAIVDLAREGVLERSRGQGTFVREPPVEEQVSVLTSFTESMRRKGHDVRTEVVRQEVITAPREITRALDASGRGVVALERVGYLADEPVAILSAFLSSRAFPALATCPLIDGSLYRTLEQRFGVVPVRADSSIGITRSGTEEAALLGVPAGSPLLLVAGTTFDEHGTPVEVFQVRYRAERFRLSFESLRSADGVRHLAS